MGERRVEFLLNSLFVGRAGMQDCCWMSEITAHLGDPHWYPPAPKIPWNTVLSWCLKMYMCLKVIKASWKLIILNITLPRESPF